MLGQETCAADKTDANTYLKSICDLLTEGKSKFFIPSYQRGYRWTCRQVEDLLNDILEFSDNKALCSNDYYCLQPLIVKQCEDIGEWKDHWEVIDGQQRLTTLYLILCYLSPDDKFKICYETRKKSVQFLNKLSNEYIKNKVTNNEEINSNVDFLHMFNAYETINNWFGEDGNKIELDVLLNHIKFIWYEVKDEDQRDVFTRFNMGKIPLSNAELIKALFLQRKNFGDQEEIIRRKQLEIAMEWDSIESTLQDDEFWYFLNKAECKTPSRIEFIFDLVANDVCKEGTKDSDFSFRCFYREFKDKDDNELSEKINQMWGIVRRYYLSLKDWYNDSEIYHHVGFLVRTEDNFSITKAVCEYQNKNKDGFKIYLKEKIDSLFKNNNHISDLHYWDENQKEVIRNILLLFNVKYTYFKRSVLTSRFPFFLYQKYNWHIEHIYPQTPQNLKTFQDWMDWFTMHMPVLEKLEIASGNSTDIDHIKKIKADLEKNIKEMEYDKLDVEIDHKKKIDYQEINNQINSLFDFDKDSIGNLVLLDQSSNQSIKNDFFSEKRSKIIERNRLEANKKEEFIFIPACTLYVFLKCFTKNPTQFHYWGKEDADDYVNVISETLKDYLPKQIKENR